MEFVDIYDENRVRTGIVRPRNSPQKVGEYKLIVCVWVHNGHGKLLLTQRAPEKSFSYQWENSGGCAQAGEDSLTAIARELREETGICAEKERFVLLDSRKDPDGFFFDYYALEDSTPLEKICLQPGETVAAKWVTFQKMEELIRNREVVGVIGRRFHADKQKLMSMQSVE